MWRKDSNTWQLWGAVRFDARHSLTNFVGCYTFRDRFRHWLTAHGAVYLVHFLLLQISNSFLPQLCFYPSLFDAAGVGGRHKCSMFPITYSEGLTGQISCIPAQNIIELFVLCFHELPHVFCPCKYLGAVHNWDLSLQVEPLVILHWTMENGRGFALAYATATEAKFVSMFYIMLSS